MMPKLLPPPSILMPFQIDAVDRWAKDYARAVAEACAAICDRIEQKATDSDAADSAKDCASAIRKAAEELGK